MPIAIEFRHYYHEDHSISAQIDWWWMARFFHANWNRARLMNHLIGHDKVTFSKVAGFRFIRSPLAARRAPLRSAPPAANRLEPSPGNGPTMKDQLGVMQYQPLAVGRDNGVTALRHDTPISVSQAEDEVMAGRVRVGERLGRIR